MDSNYPLVDRAIYEGRSKLDESEKLEFDRQMNLYNVERYIEALSLFAQSYGDGEVIEAVTGIVKNLREEVENVN